MTDAASRRAEWSKERLWLRLWHASWLTVEDPDRPLMLDRVQVVRSVTGIVVTLLVAPLVFIDWSSPEAGGLVVDEMEHGFAVVAFVHPALVLILAVLVTVGVSLRYSAARHGASRLWADVRAVLGSILGTELACLAAFLAPWVVLGVGVLPARALAEAEPPVGAAEWVLRLIVWVVFLLLALLGTAGGIATAAAGFVLFWRWSFLANRHAYRGARIDPAVAPVSAITITWAIVAADILLSAETLVVPDWAQIGMSVFGALAVTVIAGWELLLIKRRNPVPRVEPAR